MATVADAQRAVCRQYAASFRPPAADQLCATSSGVFDGEPVQGVRYAAPEHMSGWYLTTDRYDGDHRSLVVEHVSHVVERRPDIAPFLALPPGFRFDVSSVSAEAWYDEDVARAD